jgi:hypothetical protein
MTEKELEKFLSQLKERVKPSEKLAQKIMADLEVTEARENEKGRLSGYELNLNQIHSLMNKWKVIVPAAIVILIVAVWGFARFGLRGPTTGPESELSTGKEPVEEFVEKEYVKTPEAVSVPNVTGDVEDIIDAMTALSENEMVIITEEGNDASLVTLDSQAISDFGQSYDENEF